MKFSTQIKPISYLKANAAEIVRQLAEQRKPLVITQNGGGKGLLSKTCSRVSACGRRVGGLRRKQRG